MRRPAPRHLVATAAAVSAFASAASINFSGIPPLGWYGMQMIPCDLCWYQRILMYPLPVLLGIAYARRDWRGGAIQGLALAVPGFLVAVFHSLVEHYPDLEPGQCSLVSCSARVWELLGLSIPNWSALAFLVVGACCAGVLGSRHGDAAD